MKKSQWLLAAALVCAFAGRLYAQCSLTAPTNLSPAGITTNTTTPVMTWNAVAGATQYDIVYNTLANGGCSGPTIATSNTNSFNPPQLTAGAVYEWKVIAKNGTCQQASSCARFTVGQSCPSPASLVSPAANASVPAGTFTWNAVAGANSYDFYLGFDSAPQRVGNPSTTSFTINNIPAGKTGTWYVVANVPTCTIGESERRQFTTACPTVSPVLTSPANGATFTDGASIPFSWTNAGATNYSLLISKDGGSSFTTVATVNGTSTTLNNVPVGSYLAYVQAGFGTTACPTTTSARIAFSVVASCPTASPVIVSPQNGATNLTSPVTLQWSAVPNAASYRVFGAINDGTTSLLGTTTTTSLSVSLPAGTVTWFVEAKAASDDCPSTFSPRSTFTVSAGATCSTAGPVLVSPKDGATNVLSPVKFQWSAVTGAVKYRLFVSAGGDFGLLDETTELEATHLVTAGTVKWFVTALFTGCPDTRSSIFTFTVVDPTTCDRSATITRSAPADGSTQTSPVTFAWSAVANATEYRLWLSTDSGAIALIAHTTSTTATVSLPSGSVEWYVDALRANCDPVTSSHGRFTIAKATNCDGRTGATPIAPAADATVSSPVTFQWTAAAGAVAYQLWISEDGQPAADAGLTTQTQLTRTLNAGSFSWFVVTFFDGCPAVKSDRVAFKVAESKPRCGDDAPALIAPANGATNVASPVTFAWTSVDGAVEYRVFATSNDTTALLGSTTDTTLTRALPPGAYTWAVEAVFKECPSRVSPRFTFTIPRRQDCPTTPPVLSTPADGATNVASPVTFSWQPVNGAIRYVVVAKLGNGTETALGETTDTHFEQALPAGTYAWTVVALFNGCDRLVAHPFSFTVTEPAGCDNRRPLLLAPKDGARDLTPPIRFQWTPVAKAKSYNVWVSINGDSPSLIGTTTDAQFSATLPPGTIRWFVEVVFENCPALRSPISIFTIAAPSACRTPDKPEANVAGAVLSGTPYTVRWTPLAQVASFELQESTTLDFSNATTQTVDGVSATFTHTATDKAVQYLYRVRGISACSDDRGPYSNVIGVFILPPKPSATDQRTSIELGRLGNVVQTITLPPTTPPVQFSAHTDKPWLTVTPSTGTLGANGATLTVTADPTILNLGTNTGAVLLTYSTSGKGPQTNASSTPKAVPVSVSLVTPVTPAGRNTPLPESLIIPAIAHAEGANDSLFESDIRVANLGAVPMKYLVNFTPSGVNGTTTGNSTQISIEPGATTALDDILAGFFGAGNGASTTGTLEIRPLSASTTSTPSVSLVSPAPSGGSSGATTVASSRTFNSTPTGTFGQFIPAIPFAEFIAKSQVLTLQQIAQSEQYRTNFGFVEGSGEPAELLVHVFNDAGDEIAQIPVSLQAGEHKQLNGLLATNGITNLSDGRVEIEVTSSTGKVTAYASSVDNRTNDPQLIIPVQKASVSSTRYVLPGIGDFDIGIAHWKSDVRLFNAATTSVPVTLAYYAQGDVGNPKTLTLTLKGGEVRALDDFIAANFGLKATAGSLVITTSGNSSLVTTARTYTDTGNGTYGQFIPGVTPAESVGNGERAMQILQVEQSTRFRTNIGLAETSGSGPVTVEVSLVLPDSKATPVVPLTLQPNEFRQISVGDFGLGNTVYNARVTVKVIDGTGRVTAYGSNIDMQTQDPAYIPGE